MKYDVLITVLLAFVIIASDWYRVRNKNRGLTLLYWKYAQRSAGGLYGNWSLRKNPCLTDCKDKNSKQNKVTQGW